MIGPEATGALRWGASVGPLYPLARTVAERRNPHYRTKLLPPTKQGCPIAESLGKLRMPPPFAVREPPVGMKVVRAIEATERVRPRKVIGDPARY